MDNAPGFRYPSIEMRKSPDRKIWWFIGFLAFFTSAIFLLKNSQSNVPISQLPTPTPTITQPTASPNNSLTLGKRTKTSNCVSVNGLPDKACTPGDIDPRVTQDNIKQTFVYQDIQKQSDHLFHILII